MSGSLPGWLWGVETLEFIVVYNLSFFFFFFSFFFFFFFVGLGWGLWRLAAAGAVVVLGFWFGVCWGCAVVCCGSVLRVVRGVVGGVGLRTGFWLFGFFLIFLMCFILWGRN